MVWVLPARRSAALWKWCVRGFFSPQPDWELEVHMVTDNSQLSVKLFRRKCYMTDVSTTALFQTDGGKKKAPVSNQISLDRLRKRNWTHAPHFGQLLNIMSPLKTKYTAALKMCKYRAIKLSSHYRLRTTVRGCKSSICVGREAPRAATPCPAAQISSLLKAPCLPYRALSIQNTGQR